MKPVGLWVILNFITPNPFDPFPLAFDVKTALVWTSNINDFENLCIHAAAIGRGR